jgi:hypothetical protein
LAKQSDADVAAQRREILRRAKLDGRAQRRRHLDGDEWIPELLAHVGGSGSRRKKTAKPAVEEATGGFVPTPISAQPVERRGTTTAKKLSELHGKSKGSCAVCANKFTARAINELRLLTPARVQPTKTQELVTENAKMTFAIGQKVVCVDDTWPNVWPDNELGYRTPNRPKKGTVYTIRNIELFDTDPYAGEFGVRLNELVNPLYPWDDRFLSEGCFNSRRFRPPQETDISIFEKMLEPEPA